LSKKGVRSQHKEGKGLKAKGKGFKITLTPAKTIFATTIVEGGQVPTFDKCADAINLGLEI